MDIGAKFGILRGGHPRSGTERSLTHLLVDIFDFKLYEPFGLGRFATDRSQTKPASRSLFVHLIRLTSD